MRVGFGISACVISLMILMTERAPANGQVSLVFGGAIMVGTLQTPYVSRDCAKDSESGAFGTIVHAGLAVRAFSVTAGYVTAGGAESGPCFIPQPPLDGVYRVRDFSATHSGIYGWAFHLRYSPGSLPFMAYAGTGIRFGGNEFGHNTFVSLGAALRSHGRLSVFAGGEVTQLRTHFIRYDRAWQSGIVTSSTEVDRGHGWRKLEVIRLGLEYRWKFDGKE